MKVLHLHASTTLGGTELRAFQILSQLKDQLDVAVLFHASSGPICQYYQDSQIPYWTIPFPRIWPVIQKVRSFRPDVIHIFGLKTNVLWRPILFAIGYRNLIGHIAGLSNVGETPGLGRIWIDRMTLPFLRIYLSNSQRVADQLAAYGFDKTKLRVIHNGIPLPELVHPQNPHTPPVILSVGNLRRVKGHRYLLETLKILKEQGVLFKACIVGEGPDKAGLQSLTQAYGIDGQVQFRGMMSNRALHTLMADADVFALLSLSEGISGAAMEAMSHQLPVVVSDVGGMSELVSQGVEGYRVAPKETREAADRLALLLADPALRHDMGKRGYAKIESQFNIKNTVLEYKGLYDSL